MQKRNLLVDITVLPFFLDRNLKYSRSFSKIQGCPKQRARNTFWREENPDFRGTAMPAI